jgi:hypothetical protein
MKFKPIALVVIGMLLGSTITLTLTRPSASTAEILACTNKKSGKMRLTVMRECDSQTEDQSLVTDLWSLQPSTSTVQPETTTSVPRLKQYVIDSKGKQIGVLVDKDGASKYFVETQSGIWGYGVSHPQISGFLNRISLYFDSKCKRPYLSGFQQPKNAMMTAINFETDLTTDGYVATTGPLPMPKSGWIIQEIRDSNTEEIIERKCTTWNGTDSLEVEVNSSFFKSEPVSFPAYTPPLRIIEK